MANMSLKEAAEASVTYANNQRELLESEITEGISTLGSNLAQTGIDTVSSVLYAGEDLADITNAAGNAAYSYLQKKIQNIKDGLRYKTPVEVRALLGEVSPYVQDPVNAAKALSTKIDSLGRYILGVGSNGTIADAIGDDFIQFLSQDEGVQETLANLGAVKTFANALNTAADAISSAQRIMKIVEPLIPIMEVTYELFSAARTQNLAAGVDAQNKAMEEVQKKAQQLTTLLLGSFRKYIYSLKIEVPNLILGAISTVSVRDAVLNGDWSNGWLKAVFDEDFYASTMYSYTWEDSWNKTIRDTLGSADATVRNWSELNFTDMDGNPLIRGDFMKSKFMNTFTQNFMKKAVATARKNAYIRDYSLIKWSGRSGSPYVGKVSVMGSSLGESGKSIEDVINNVSYLSPFNSTSSIRILSKQITERYE